MVVVSYDGNGDDICNAGKMVMVMYICHSYGDGCHWPSRKNGTDDALILMLMVI